MTKNVELDKLRPNKWYLDRKKLEKIRIVWRDGNQKLLPEVIVTSIDDELSLIDGHCRAYAAWENGAMEIYSNIVSLNQINGNSGIKKLYVNFHRQGPILGIRTVKDLGNRIVDLSNMIDPDIAMLLESVSD